MKTIEEVTAEVKAILASKQYCVQCQYSGSHVPETELDRANAYGEAQLKSVSDSDISDAFSYCKERGSEDDFPRVFFPKFDYIFKVSSITARVLFRLAEKDFSTPYENISFIVYLW